MTGSNRVEDLRNRIVGQRYYDTESDESLTVVGLTTHEGKPELTLLQYDDGVALEEGSMPDMLTPEVSSQVGLEEGGIDSERYIPLGSGPTIEKAVEWCPDGTHEWTPQPDDIWPEGVPNKVSRDTYNNLVRCKRCGISGAVALEFMDGGSPWFCARCGGVEDGNELAYLVEDWENQPVCADCRADIA